MPFTTLKPSGIDLSQTFNFTGTLQQNGGAIAGGGTPQFNTPTMSLSATKLIGV